MRNMMRNRCNLQLLMFFLLLAVGNVFSITVYVETGKNFIFQSYLRTRFESVQWTVNNNTLVEYEDGLVKWSRFEGGGSLDTQTGVLTLNGLKKSDSGFYVAEFVIRGKLWFQFHNIIVIDAVPQPKVACIKNNTGEVSLECSVDFNISAEFQWTGPGNVKHTGRTLYITNGTDHTAVYICTAENPVSNKSTEFSLKECEKGDVFRKTIYVEAGKSFIFRPNIQTRIEALLWTVNRNNVVEYEDGSVKWFQFEDRGSLDTQTGVLTLNGLKKSDSGFYEAEILTNGKLWLQSYNVRVIDAVPQP